jgi:hypothetical protein
MNDISILFSKNSDEWGTPPDLATDLGTTHGITVDVACRSTNAKYPIALAIDKGIDGLKFPWHEIPSIQNGNAAFCNPPHSTIVQWITKVIDESDEGVKTVMLIPASTGTDHWHNLVLPNAVEIQEVKHRISFYGRIKIPNQPKDMPKEDIKYKMGYAPATFDSAIVIFDRSRPRIGGKPLRTEYIQPKERKYDRI